MAKSSALAKQEETALATTFVDLDQDSAAYQDNFTREDYAVPFLKVLQNGSPEVQVGAPTFVQGAVAGALFNTLNKEVYDGKKGIIIVPASYEKTFIEWKLREKGGGFVKDHKLQGGLALRGSTKKDEKNRDILPNGNHLVETAQFVVLIVGEDGTLPPAMFSLVSTQLKKARGFVSTIDSIRVERNGVKKRPPMFFTSYKVTTVYESNDKGNWQGVIIVTDKNVEEMENGPEVYETAKALRQSVDAGAVSVEKSAEAAGEAAPF